MIWLLISVYSGSSAARFKEKTSTKLVYLGRIAMGALSAFNKTIWTWYDGCTGFELAIDTM